MITLPGQFEFLSDAWLEEARSFLQSKIAATNEGVEPFSISERFADAPPHLEFDDNIAQWQVCFADNTLTVSREFDATADLLVEGDYQAALMLAQTIGALAPGVTEATLHEVQHVFGKLAVCVQGKLKNPATNQLLGLLHDHLGRRTVENPDLTHRADRLGISEQMRDLTKNGYTVIEHAISSQFADEVRAATLRSLLSHHHFQLQWMLYHGQEFERIVQNPQLMTLIDASLGRGAVIASLSSVRRGPGKGNIALHTDYVSIPEPYPEFALTGVGVWALEDWCVASGPTWIVPGSHKLRRPPRKDEATDGAIPIEMPKGSVVYFTHGLWHWQGDRTEPGERVTLHMHFNRGILRGLEPKKIDVQMMHRNPPRLGEMLGEDDWFDKMTAQGRDYSRLAYMTRLQAFSEASKHSA